MNLSVVIVAHNGADVIRACLTSIARLGEGVEIIVVDNASTDDTARAVRESCPEAELITSQENRGFGGGCGVGIAAASWDYILLLNQDCELSKPLKPLLDDMRARPELAVLGGRTVYPNGETQHTIGRRLSPTRLVLSWVVPLWIPVLGPLFSRMEIADGQYEVPTTNAPWVSGAFFLLRKSVWNELGGFDPAFFMYMEDVDYCHRAKRAGHSVGYSPSATAVHAERSGAHRLNSRVLHWTVQGYCRFLGKQYGVAILRVFRYSLATAFAWDALVLGLASGVPRWRDRAHQASAFLKVAGWLTKATHHRNES